MSDTHGEANEAPLYVNCTDIRVYVEPTSEGKAMAGDADDPSVSGALQFVFHNRRK